jgi:hypothetical protein
LLNISTRLLTRSGENVAIGGFINAGIAQVQRYRRLTD